MIWVHSRELIGVEQALRRCHQAVRPSGRFTGEGGRAMCREIRMIQTRVFQDFTEFGGD